MMDWSPHQHMRSLDAKGTAYQIEDLWMNGKHIENGAADVVGHSEQWLAIRQEGGTRYFPMSQISFTIEEL